jgi:hypothetical protein
MWTTSITNSHPLHWHKKIKNKKNEVSCPPHCRNPNLGLAIKARGCKVAGQEGDPKVTSHAPESAKSVREWALTLPSELQCWELESQMDSRIFRVRCKGQNSSPRRVLYIIEKILKFKCLKWACIAHLDIWNTSYGQKKGHESDW